MSPDRTPEEREQARLEREARRAGKPPPPPLPPPATPAARPPKPPPPAQGRPQKPPTYQPQTTVAPPPEAPAAPPGGGEGRGAQARRAAASRMLERHRKSRDGEGPPRRRSPLRVGMAGLLGIVLAWFLLSLLQPFGGDGGKEIRVTIPRGAGVGDIADLLDEKGVVSSGFFFNARATLSGKRGDLKPGIFKLKDDMSYGAALDALAGGPPPDLVNLTVPEGRARREVKAIVGRNLSGDYLAVTRRSRLLDPRAYGARNARDLEGFLFPATYELKRRRPVGDLVNEQLRAFKREFGKVDLAAAKRRNLTAYDVLIIASMVDREAQVPRERAIIASVIYNRLREGIPLGIDATVRFATNNWTKPLTQSQLAIDSRYNTRNRQGLPPGPIGSPGLAAMKAAARPAGTRFLFYVVKPGTCGEHDFSATDAEFQQDVDRYNRERRRRGGKSPTNC